MNNEKPRTKVFKNAGRKKGSPNKRSWDLVETLEKLGFDPLAKLVQLTLDGEVDYKENRHNEMGPMYYATTVKACTEMLSYVYPKRKAIDITSAGQKIDSLASLLQMAHDHTEIQSNEKQVINVTGQTKSEDENV